MTISPHYKRLLEAHRSREDFQRAATRLLLQIKAICRRRCAKPYAGNSEAQYKRYRATIRADADKLFAAMTKKRAKPHPLAAITKLYVAPLLECWQILDKKRKGYEYGLLFALDKAVAPSILAWADGTKGLGRVSLAKIVAEAGGPLWPVWELAGGKLRGYPNPVRLWKRFGLAIVDGEIQRRCKDKAKALKMGYNPCRRALMHVVGECLLKANGPYAKLYRDRKAWEKKKAPKLTKMHLHRRAMRWMEKRLLADLWQTWGGVREVAKAA